MISVAIVTLTFLVPHLQYYESTLSVVENDELVLDDEEVQQQQQQKLSEGIQNYNSFDRLECHVMIDRQIEEISANIMSMTTTTTTTP